MIFKPVIKIKIIALACIFCLLVVSCKDNWEDHYQAEEEEVDMNIWEFIKTQPKYSLFVEKMIEYDLDTLFESELSYTLFIPGESSLESLQDTSVSVGQILTYHISPTLFQVTNVRTSRKIQTKYGKYATIENAKGSYTYDGIPVEYSSPLFQNGKYYEIEEVSFPKPNLYEFVSLYSDIIRDYIDSQDSVYLDRRLSNPIGFDTYGNTIYDSVFTRVNLFEETFFPVSKEFRDQSATFILFTQDQYLEGLEEMAAALGFSEEGSEKIPAAWQYNVLLPKVMGSAMLEGMLEYSDLMADTLQSITGDTIVLDHRNIDPESRFLCSNGVVFLYNKFIIDSALYNGEYSVEGEMLIDSVGAGKWTWKKDVKVTGAITEPVKLLSATASEEAVINVELPRSYSGEYTLEFFIKNVLPMRYRLVWRGNSRPSGLYAIFINGEKIGEFNSFNFRSTILSVTGEYFIPFDGYNRKDFWVDHLTEFGDVSVKFVYLSSGGQNNNGLNIDYVKLIPDL
jgi:hypothetical protein